MFKLLNKKSFFNGWDNILVLALSNVVFCAVILGVIFWDFMPAFLILFLPFSFHMMGMNAVAHKWAYNRKAEISDYTQAIKNRFWHIILFYFILCLMFYSVSFAIPYYLLQMGMIGMILGFALLWLSLLCLAALMYYFPMALEVATDSPFRTLKKCFILFFDNFTFSLKLLVKNAVDCALSVLTSFLLPGFTGISITNNNAVKFLMQMYSAEEGEEFLQEDYLLMKDRNLRTLFTPWKNN